MINQGHITSPTIGMDQLTDPHAHLKLHTNQGLPSLQGEIRKLCIIYGIYRLSFINHPSDVGHHRQSVSKNLSSHKGITPDLPKSVSSYTSRNNCANVIVSLYI